MAEPSDEEIMRTIADDLPVGVWVAQAPGGDFVYAKRMFGEIMGMVSCQRREDAGEAIGHRGRRSHVVNRVVRHGGR